MTSTDTNRPVSVQEIIDTIPLGTIIRYADGTARPPAHHKRKLQDWENNNGSGRLVEKTPASGAFPAHFRLHIGDFGANGVVVIKAFQTFTADTHKTLFAEQLPASGSIQILDKTEHATELVHLAADQAGAEAWIASHSGRHYVLEPIT